MADAGSTDDELGSFSSSVWKFPVDDIIGSKTTAAVVARLLWLIVPVDYYVLSKLPGGMTPRDFIAQCVHLGLVVLTCVFVGFALASATGSRSRVWTISLLLAWMASVTLMGFSLTIEHVFGGGWRDVVANFECDYVNCSRFPSVFDPAILFFDPATLLIFGTYSLIATVVLAIVCRAGLKLSGNRPYSKVNIFVLAAANAVLMTILLGLPEL